MGKGLTKRSEDYSKWYNELVVKADLAENSAVRGCMVIKPYGYAIWEKMQAELDKKFKETGHQNAYFPLFVPKSLFEAEEKNAEGFAKECAVVTHYRLKTDPEDSSKLIADPDAGGTQKKGILDPPGFIATRDFQDGFHPSFFRISDCCSMVGEVTNDESGSFLPVSFSM